MSVASQHLPARLSMNCKRYSCFANMRFPCMFFTILTCTQYFTRGQFGLFLKKAVTISFSVSP